MLDRKIDIKEAWEARLGQEGLQSILNTSELLKKSRSVGDADVYRYVLQDGISVLIKTYRARPWFIRSLLASCFLRHEFKILKMLKKDGAVRAPVPYSLVGKDTIVMEFFEDAKTLRGAKHYAPGEMPSREFFLELVECIRHLHQKGIAHGDLRRGNVMVDNEGHPRLIDVATACHSGITGCWSRRFLFKMIRRSDNYSLARIVGSYYEDLMDEELQCCLRNAPWYLKVGRFLRQKIYRPLRGKRQGV